MVNMRLKVLVGAYACSPAQGSELGVGWGWVESISKYHDLWVLVGEQSRREIDEELARRPELRESLQFLFIPRTRFHIFEKVWPPLYLWTYQWQWQRAALRVAKRVHSEVHFDLVHQLTYVGFRVPGYLWKLNLPFVWGPIGGLEQTSWRLIPALGIRGALHFASRNIINSLQRRFARLPRRAFAQSCSGTIAATSQMSREIRRFFSVDATVIPEVGMPVVGSAQSPSRAVAEPLRLVWCGGHNPGKALPFLFRALEWLSDLPWELTIIGKGPCTTKWRRMAEKRKLNDRCRWIGQVNRVEVLNVMATQHVMVITSVYDLTSTVLVEALSLGLPVICPDHCGFVDAVNASCGIRVSAESPGKLIQGLHNAIRELSDEQRRTTLSHGALARSSMYRWETKAVLVNEIYNRKLAETNSSRPSVVRL